MESKSNVVRFHRALDRPTASPTPVSDTKRQSVAPRGHVVVVIDPVTAATTQEALESKAVAKTPEKVQNESLAASKEIGHSLSCLRRRLAMQTQAEEIYRRCLEDEASCRDRSARCVVLLGAVAIGIAGAVTDSWALGGSGIGIECVAGCYFAVAPATLADGARLLRISCRQMCERRPDADLDEPADMQLRIAELEQVQQTLMPHAIAAAVRAESRLPAELAGIIGDYAAVPKDAAPPPDRQAMG